ncbi:MAG: energy-coupling factor transporter transmembrane component T family protein [Coriobacteriia bacterium]
MIRNANEHDLASAVPKPRGGGRSLARRTADSIGAAITEVLENEDLALSPGLLQSLDPRVKLASLVGFAVVTSFVHSIPVLVGLSLLPVGLAAVSRVRVSSFLKKLWASAGLFAVLLAAPAATSLITPGPALVSLGALSLTLPGVLGALTLIFRVTASAGFALLIIWTTRWTDILLALTAWHVPDIIVATLALTQKQILSLLRTVEQTHLARESRSLSTGSAAENRAWVTERMAFVVRKSLKTADDVYDAMLSRGYTGAMRSINRLRATRRDWVWFAVSLCAAACVLLADRMLR